MMNQFRTLAILLACFIAGFAIAEQPQRGTDADFDLRSRTLFDGQSLAGWEGTAYWFHINGNSIVAGRLEQKIPENQFLCTTEQFDDFDLRFETRLVGIDSVNALNAGVQIRSRRPGAVDSGVPRNEMIGYQADIGSAWGRSVWGALYDESRRRIVLAESTIPIVIPGDLDASNLDNDPEVDNDPDLASPSSLRTTPSPRTTPSLRTTPSPKMTPWVSMRVLCKGARIQIFVNGIQTVDYTETDASIPQVGVIGFQIHSGPPAECWYRNIRILSIE